MSPLQEEWALPRGGWQGGAAWGRAGGETPRKGLGVPGPVPWTVGTEHRDNEKMSLQEVWSGCCAQEFQPHLWDVPQVGCAEGGGDGDRWADQQGCFPVFWPKG